MKAVFCDFDGTISESDLIVSIARAFAPAAAAAVLPAVAAGALTVRAAVDAMIGAVPAAAFGRVRAFALAAVKIRPGFPEFVSLCADRGWPLFVVSGGFDFFVEPALAPYAGRLECFTNRVGERDGRLRVVWPHPCDELCANRGGCGLCKPALLRRLAPPGALRVLVGDGVTDLPAARAADFIFARDRLLAECRRLGLAHAPFDTFCDIVSRLKDCERGGASS